MFVYRVSVVLGGNVDAACLKVLYRVISAAVAIFQLICICAGGSAIELMSETDGKTGNIRFVKLSDFFDDLRVLCRISRAVESMIPSGFVFKTSSAGVSAGYTVTSAASLI